MFSIMASSEGPDNEPFRMTPSLMPSPGVYNNEIFEKLDIVLETCRKLGSIRVIMSLGNFWHWSGGFAQYISWFTGEKINYPSRDPATWPDFERSTEGFYTNENCQKLFKEHIKMIMNRRNSMNKVLYKQDPVIMAWELANEPRNAPFEWIREIAGYIKSVGDRQLVTVGVEGIEQDRKVFRKQHESKYVDFTTGHCWVEVHINGSFLYRIGAILTAQILAKRTSIAQSSLPEHS